MTQNCNWSALYRIDNAHHDFDLFISILDNSKQKFLFKKKYIQQILI